MGKKAPYNLQFGLILKAENNIYWKHSEKTKGKIVYFLAIILCINVFK